MGQLSGWDHVYPLREIAEFEVNMISDFRLHDTLARDLTRSLAKKIFWAYPKDIDWLEEMHREKRRILGQ